MKFWDSSAVLPLIVDEPASPVILSILRQDTDMVLWWASSVESNSALQRRSREGALSLDQL